MSGSLILFYVLNVVSDGP